MTTEARIHRPQIHTRQGRRLTKRPQARPVRPPRRNHLRKPGRFRPPPRCPPRRTRPPEPNGINPRRPHRKPLLATKTSRPNPKPDNRRIARGKHRYTIPRPHQTPHSRESRPRPNPRPHRTKRLLKRKGPRSPPDVRKENRAQPVQNDPRTPKTPPTPKPRPPQRRQRRSRSTPV